MKNQKKALILGVLGQDGSYMAELLYSKGYKVYGLVKEDTSQTRINWIKSLVPNIEVYRINILNKIELSYIIKTLMPEEIYNFAGFTVVTTEWSELDSIFNLNSRVIQNILDIVLKENPTIKIFQASSCLIFGNDTSGIQNELTPASPIYPYGITKLYSTNIIKEYRDTFGLFCCSGIFYPHESERRNEMFFTRKITKTLAKILAGTCDEIVVGNTSASRDYGYAPDYMEAVYLMMNNSVPTDYVIGSGELIKLNVFIDKCFNYVGLSSKDYIRIEPSLFRAKDLNILKADITKIKTELGWHPTKNIDDIIKIMVDYDIKNLKL